MTFILFLLVGLLGGTVGALVKFATFEIPAVLLVSIRLLIALVIFTPIFLKLKIKIPKNKIKILSVSGLLLSANIILFSIGVQHTSVIMSQLIYVPTSIIVGIFGYLFLKEKISFNQILGLFMTIIGMLILITGSFKTRDIQTFGEPFGNVLIIIALFCWSGYLLLSRKIVKDYSPTASAFANFAVAFSASLLLLPIEYANNNYSQLQISTSSYVALLMLGIASALFIFLYQYFIKKTSAFVASLITYMNPIVASILGVSFFNETLTPNLIVGSLVVITGVFMATTYNYFAIKNN